jgi:hypothetical protein
MLLVETAIFYLLFGAAVATAVYARRTRQRRIRTAFDVASAFLFWPLYVPVLLAPAADRAVATATASNADRHDSLSDAIAQVESELDAALEGLDGWAEDVLNSEQHRLEELRTAWRLQAERIRELDHLLSTTEAGSDPVWKVAGDMVKARESENVRRENIRQLGTIRRRMHADLIGTLAWVRELVTMIHLAKFSGAPAARAEELVAQIAAAVQGLSEVSAWREQEELATAAR